MAVLAQVEAITRDRINGWAVDDGSPDDPVIIELLMDDEIVAGTMARLPRSEFADPARRIARRGFSLRLPPDMVVDQARMTLLAGQQPVEIPPALFAPEGVLETVLPNLLTGWAWRIGYPGQPVELAVLHRGEVIARTVADGHRADLETARVGYGHHGFTCPLPLGFAPDDLGPEDLQVVEVERRWPLQDTRKETKRESGLPPKLELLRTQQRG